MKPKDKTQATEQQIARFWTHVRKRGPDECWNWQASIINGGYGQVQLANPRRMVLAHRLAYAAAYGEVPSGKQVHHRCDNRRCCNPAHLWVGTQHDNIADAIAKGRYKAAGEHNPKAKIGPDEVRQIRKLAGASSQREIAERFGVSQQNVSAILRRETWRDV